MAATVAFSSIVAVSARLFFRLSFGFHIFPYFSLSLSKIPHLAGAAATKTRVEASLLCNGSYW